MTINDEIREELRRMEERLGVTNDVRTELHDGVGLWFADEPVLGDYLVSLGFVVERENRVHPNGYRDVLVRTTPPADEILHSATWHYEGPTAPRGELRIRWNEDALEAVLADARHGPEYEPPELPADPAVVVEGDGWDAVAPSEHVVENAIIRRSSAERAGYDILGPVPSDIKGAEKYNLVEIDAEPAPYSKRTPTPGAGRSAR